MAFRRLPGKTRRYIDDATGIEISYRQYRNYREAEGIVRRLDSVALANQRRRQMDYNRRAAHRAERIAAERLSRLDTSRMGLVEAARAEREALRGIKAQVIKSPGLRADLDTIKRLGSMKSGTRSAEQESALIQALENMGYRDGVPKGVPVGSSDKFRKGLMRRTRDGAYRIPSGPGPKNLRQKIPTRG